MKKCGVCKGVYEEEECPFEKELGLVEGYAMVRQGKVENAEIQKRVARWVLHSAEEHTETLVEWAEKMVER